MDTREYVGMQQSLSCLWFIAYTLQANHKICISPICIPLDTLEYQKPQPIIIQSTTLSFWFSVALKLLYICSLEWSLQSSYDNLSCYHLVIARQLVWVDGK